MRNRSTLLMSAFALSLLSTPVRADDLLPSYRPKVATEQDAVFPSIERATRPQGVFEPAQHIAMVTPGMKKSQIYSLLDVPHFKEGLFGVRKWNYILNFYTGNNDEYRQCQYQIQFDKHYRVESTWWKDEACSVIFNQALGNSRATRAPDSAEHVRRDQVQQTYNFTFAFDKTDIDAAGQEVIAEVVRAASSGQFHRIVVVGFTDTMGTTEYNDNLAARRAAIVSQQISRELAKLDSPLQSMVFARGGRDLAITTKNNVREERNRRVIIELY